MLKKAMVSLLALNLALTPAMGQTPPKAEELKVCKAIIGADDAAVLIVIFFTMTVSYVKGLYDGWAMKKEELDDYKKANPEAKPDVKAETKVECAK